MPCFVCFLNFPCNKKRPKNKSSQNALEILYDFFLNISEFLVQIIPEGGAPGGHNPPGRARTPRWVVVPMWAPSLTSSSHIITYLQKKISIALSLPCFCSQTRIFQSLCSKLRFRNCFGGLLLGM